MSSVTAPPATNPLDPSVAAYYDTRIAASQGNASQLAALQAAKAQATQAYASINPAYTQDIFKIMDMGPAGVAGDPQMAKERDALIAGGFLQDTASGDQGEAYTLGLNAPHNMAAYSGTGDLAPSPLRLQNVNESKSNNQTLADTSMVAHTQLWGDMTYQGNIVQPKSGWDTFWKVAPMLPALFATVVSGGTLSPMMLLFKQAFTSMAGYEMSKPPGG